MAIQPSKADLRVLCQSGRFRDALELGARLCTQNPGDPEVWFIQAVAHGALDEFSEAEKCCRKALTIAPDHSLLHYNLGMALIKQDRPEDAEEVLRHALSIDASNPEIAAALADSLMQQGKPAQAVGIYKSVLKSAPTHLRALANLALANRQMGHIGEAIDCYKKASEIEPYLPGIFLDWSHLLIEQGDLDQALVVTESGLNCLPAQADLLYQAGYLLSEIGRNEEALQKFEACLTLQGSHLEARFGRAMIRRYSGRHGEAAEDLQFILDADTGNARAHASLAGLYQDEGDTDAMIRHLSKAVELAPENADLQHNFLMNQHYSRDPGPQELFEAHRNWGERHGWVSHARDRHVNEPDTGRVLRVGYVSSDFKGHSVSHFIEPVLDAHDHSRFLVFCYSNLHTSQHDATTARIRNLSDLWRDVFPLSDRDLADLIAADGIDILVDLSGHTNGNRLGAFALRPAPIQLSWIGYPDTTGLPAMDYRITDAYADPVGIAEPFSTEKLLRMDGGFLCYAPPADAPECGEPPCCSHDYVTFGSLNNLAKMNSGVIETWSGILNSVPRSRLLLKGAALADNGICDRISARFSEHGISRDRLELLAYTRSTREHLACYNLIDIALDTFPYNGTTTTCEALWMGVPVITCAGEIHACRVGTSLLRQVNLEEFVATNRDDYIHLAKKLVNDPGRILSHRLTLRDRISMSSLMDRERMCDRLENSYHQIWRKWCEDNQS